MSRFQTAIIGAGILGLSIADELSRRGHAVVIVDHPDPHRLASGRSFSWLNSFGIAPSTYHRLRLEGIDRYRRLLPQGDGWLAFPGSFNLITDVARADQLLEHHAATAYPVQRIAAEKVARYEPALDPSAISSYDILGVRDEGWIDLPPYLALLRDRIVASGGQFATDRDVRLVLNGDRIQGVALSGGESIEADATVIAAGAATPALLSQVNFVLPQRTNNGLVVRVKPPEGFALRHVVRTPGISLRPDRSGEFVLHSNEADENVKQDDDLWDVPDDVIDRLIVQAQRLLAGQPQLSLVDYGVGLRPIPGDGFAVVGAIPAIAGLFTAFSHSAATLGPVIGELLAAEVAGEEESPLLSDFRPGRFVSLSHETPIAG